MNFEQLQSEFEKIESAIDRGPLVPHVSAAEVRARLESRFSFESSMPLDEVVAEVEKMLREWQVQVTHPRYFGLYNPSVTLSSVVAETLVAMYNSQLANWRTSPAANEMERHTLAFLAARFGFPAESIATFTSGGSEANLTAAVVALTWAFPQYGEFGLRSLKGDPTIYLTEETHHGFNKIAHIAGLGRRNLRVIATNAELKMDLDALRRAIVEDRAKGNLPFMVIGTAGTTAAGVIDPLPQIANICREEELWFHADAAYGGGAVLSDELRVHLNGIEQADSITCDAHKWLSVAMGCGMFFSRHRDSVEQAFRSDVTYMPSKSAAGVGEDTFNPLTHSIQWSRRFIGLKLFMTLAEKGANGYAAMLEHQARMADVLREELAATGWTIRNSTPFPVILFDRSGIDIPSFVAKLRDEQIAWMSDAEVKGGPVVRACVTSFKTTEKDIRWVVGKMNELVAPSIERKTA